MTSRAAELATQLVAKAAAAGVRVAVAESLTGGLVAAEIVAVPGASQIFAGSVTAYDTRVKERLLGVSGSLLAADGPVQPEVAEQMAAGLTCLGVPFDFAVATTGVAGPDPDPATGKPAGLFYIGVFVAKSGECKSFAYQVSGSRAKVREQAVVAALMKLLAEVPA